MPEKYFTLDEAVALLPFIEQEINELQKIKMDIKETYRELQQKKALISKKRGGAAMESDPFFMLEAKLDFMMHLAEGHMNRILETGAEIKDIEWGLVDFPARLDGEDVLLCWKKGEDTISHWHFLQDGFAGRKKIEPGMFEEAD